jgi:anti-sigma regulatory factor (Ser/Thr protein kinase)
MSARSPNVLLGLDARAENVSLVREAIAGLADAVDLGAALDDIKAAVSEACNNVVLHAYEDGGGPLEVELLVSPGELAVLVRDHGVGTSAPVVAPDLEFPARGIGLTVIASLADRSEVNAAPGHGTQVAMWFEIPDRREQPVGATQPTEPDSGDVRIAIAPPLLCGAILNRLVGALGARAGFSIDRLSDTQLVTDAIAARIGPALDGQGVSAAINVLEGRRIELRLERLAPGGATALLAASAVDPVGSVIERLSDELEVSDTERGETLRLVLADPWERSRS